MYSYELDRSRFGAARALLTDARDAVACRIPEPLRCLKKRPVQALEIQAEQHHVAVVAKVLGVRLTAVDVVRERDREQPDGLGR